ncbi:unnamed protein product [Diamesa serratosioi]
MHQIPDNGTDNNVNYMLPQELHNGNKPHEQQTTPLPQIHQPYENTNHTIDSQNFIQPIDLYHHQTPVLTPSSELQILPPVSQFPPVDPSNYHHHHIENLGIAPNDDLIAIEQKSSEINYILDSQETQQPINQPIQLHNIEILETSIQNENNHQQQQLLDSQESLLPDLLIEQQEMTIQVEPNQLESISFTQSVENQKSPKEILEINNDFQNQENQDEKITISPDQKRMLKALGVVHKENQNSGCTKKKRRRILQLNDDDSDDNTNDRDLLNKSPTPEHLKSIIEDPNKPDTEDSSEDSESDSDQANTNPQVLKARSLLKGAVIIQANEKKRKIRVLESDDEEQMEMSVDDIGAECNDIFEENYNVDLLGSEIIDESNETVISIENPIIPQDDDFAVPAIPVRFVKSEVNVESNKIKSELRENVVMNALKHEQDGISNEMIKIVKLEDDNNDDSALNIELILDNIKPMDDNDSFFQYSKSSDDDDDDVTLIPNDVYFGTPDKVTIPETMSDSSEESEDSTYSEDSSSSESSGDRNKPISVNKVVHRKPAFNKPKQNFTVTRVPIKKKLVSAKDRFYDKSREIPNDIYFGDVKVPLHVLHTKWDPDNDISSSESSEDQDHYTYSKGRVVPKVNRTSWGGSGNSSTKSFSYIEPNEDPRLSNMKNFVKLAGIKINFSRLFDGISSTDDKCMLIRRILTQKGLDGEPTVAKCKQLRLDLQTKREIAELDTSVILKAEGRTRRSARGGQGGPSKFVPPLKASNDQIIVSETLQTLSKIRRIIDSDSE